MEVIPSLSLVVEESKEQDFFLLQRGTYLRCCGGGQWELAGLGRAVSLGLEGEFVLEKAE